MQHRESRRVVQFFLEMKGRSWKRETFIAFDRKFVELHKLQKRFQGHSCDIITDEEVIEIDGMNTRHSKKSQKINDGIFEAYIEWLGTHKFYRLQQEEIVNERGHIQEDVYHYLRTNLF